MGAPSSWSLRWLGVAGLATALAGPGSADETVSQAPVTHALAAVAEARQARPVTSVAAIPVATCRHADRFRDALEHQTYLDFIETPLREVVEFLADMHKLQIFIKETTLDQAGISSEELVTINVQDISLRSALGLLLAERGLDYLVANEVLVITSRADAERSAETRVYRVGDLIPYGSEGRTRHSLVDVLTTSVTPKAWGDDCGYASVVPFGDTLVIRHTYRGHEQVEQLFAALRAAMDKSHEGSEPAGDAEVE